MAGCGGRDDGGEQLVCRPLPLTLPLAQRSSGPCPVVHTLVCGGASSALLTRSSTDLPDTANITLLVRLQAAITMAQQSRSETFDKGLLAANLRCVCNGVDMIFGCAAAISAAFGFRDGVGLNVTLLDSVVQDILKCFPDKKEVDVPDDLSTDASICCAITDLHKFSMLQAMFKSATSLLDDLAKHVFLLGTPERAQVLLAAAQHPLLAEHHFAKALLPKLCQTILSAPSTTRHLLVRWWSEYPADLLEHRVVRPIQSYLTKELQATKKLTVSVMNAIKVLAKVEEANQLHHTLPPDVFYNQLISDKMDVQDHYTAWRQTQDLPAVRRAGLDGPFSFCSYPFLLDPRAKSNLLHIEARYQMDQTIANARMEAQLYGSGSRARQDDHPIVSKTRLTPAPPQHAAPGATGEPDSSTRPRSASLFRGLWYQLTHRRAATSAHTPAAPQAATTSPPRLHPRPSLPRVGSFNLPPPSLCTMPSTHSDMCIVRVRRMHLLGDALDEVARQTRRDLYKPLRVHFIGEEGIDAGGVRKEFFTLLFAELLDPRYGMLVQQPETRTYWINGCCLESDDMFMLLGLCLGLAVYNRVLLDLPLPLALYKKLLGLPVGLRDLELMSPTLGRSLRKLLQWDGPPGSVEDTFTLNFTLDVDFFGEVRSVELKPGGEEVAVTEENRHEYVELLVEHLLNGAVRKQFDSFAAGFRVLCDGPAIKLFNAQELERLVCGNPNLDFDALQRNAKYEGGFSASTPAVCWLWESVHAFSGEEQRCFLKFFTGSDRAPIGGLGTLKCVIQRDGPDSCKLPTSHTCFNTLLLPEYATRGKMERLIRLAILNSEGFGLE